MNKLHHEPKSSGYKSICHAAEITIVTRGQSWEMGDRSQERSYCVCMRTQR